MRKLAIIGAGKLGEALLSGLLRAGRSADDIVVTEHSADRVAYENAELMAFQREGAGLPTGGVARGT